jgi:SH3 domain-containing YSC84-like protein 1
MKSIFVFALVLAVGSLLCSSQQAQQSQGDQTQQAQPQTAQPPQPDQTPTDQSSPQPSQSSQASQTPDQQNQAQPSQTQTQQPQASQGQTPRPPDTTNQQLYADRQYMAEVRNKATNRLASSADTMNSVLNGKFLAKGLVDNAKCVIVIPSVKRAGFIFGFDYGRGTMSCRLGENFKGPFSAPSMIALEGGNFGAQIGVQVSDLVLLVMNERGVNSLLGSKSKLGVDASVAAGPFGRSGAAATDMGMKADILAVSRTGGAYIGAVLAGSSLRPDTTANAALYNRDLPAKYIVRSGEVPVPAAGRRLVSVLDETTTVVAQAPKKP